MSSIEIADLSELASARLASRYQRAALTPFARRLPLDRYQPTRAPWAHGFWAAQDNRFGKWHPADAKIAQFLESLPPASCLEAYEKLRARRAELEALGYVFERPVPNACVLTPPPPLPPIIGPTPRPPRPPVAPRPPPPAPAPLDPDAYTILDTGGLASATIARAQATTTGPGRVTADATLPGPSLAIGVHISFGSDSAQPVSWSFECPAIGLYYAAVQMQIPQTEEAKVNLPMHALLRAPAHMHIEANVNVPPGFADSATASLIIAYRDVRLRRAPAAPPSELPCLSLETYDQLADAGYNLVGLERGCVDAGGVLI